MLKYRLDLKIYDEVVEINDEVKSLDKKFDVSIFKTKKDLKNPSLLKYLFW